MSRALNTRQWRGISSSLLDGAVHRLPRRYPAFGHSLSLLQSRHLSIAQLNHEKRGRERVVVLGSGWAGFTIARQLDPKLYQVIVVSPRSYFVFTPLLASTSVGTLEFRTALEPIRSKRKPVQFLQGWADGVDFGSKTITIEAAVDDPRQATALTEDRRHTVGKEQRSTELSKEKQKGELFDLGWDKLVISVGCYSQTFSTPGVKENAMFLKDVGDARRIRNRLLASFELAACPTTTDAMRKVLLNFAIVGGGPTGIEFSAELHDIIREDMARLYPDLMSYYKITVYDVAPKVLSMFDEKLGQYAMKHLQREGVQIKTSHHVEELRRGPPKSLLDSKEIKDPDLGWTLDIKEEGEVGVGMCVWSTGLMMNPFVEQRLAGTVCLPAAKESVKFAGIPDGEARKAEWVVEKDKRSGGVMTDNKLRILLQPKGSDNDAKKAVLQDVFALGDCAVMKDTMYPVTAQVASQKAVWLSKRLNARDIDTQEGFHWKNMGVMAYLGNWNAILQSSGGDVSGRAAWFIWRGAYLTKAVSWRNKILIPIYWFINWLFGRDVSRF